MTERNPGQTAIFTIVPTSELDRYVGLLEGAEEPPNVIDTFAIPADRQEAARVLGRLLGEGGQQVVTPRVMAIGYTVTPHATRPTSLIENVTTGKTVEAITKENLRQVSRSYRGASNVGGSLANLLYMDDPPVVEGSDVLSPYMTRYQPKRTPRRAILVEKARGLLDFLQDPPPKLWVNDSHRELLGHVCELIETDTDISGVPEET